MWTEGTIGVPAGDGKMTAVHYWVKHYDEPSEWGIDGGRISKLMLKQNGVIVYNYDRGEDVAPQTPEAQTALAILKQEFNEKGDGGLKNAHKAAGKKNKTAR